MHIHIYIVVAMISIVSTYILIGVSLLLDILDDPDIVLIDDYRLGDPYQKLYIIGIYLSVVLGWLYISCKYGPPENREEEKDNIH